jgi:hypothetical protein
MFTELQESEESPFYQAENHDLFVFAVGYCRKYGSPQPVESEEHAFFGRSRLSEIQQNVLEAVAVSEHESAEVLRDQRQLYRLAEQLANGGVEALYQRVFESDGDPLSELTLDVKEAHEAGAEDMD